MDRSPLGGSRAARGAPAFVPRWATSEKPDAPCVRGRRITGSGDGPPVGRRAEPTHPIDRGPVRKGRAGESQETRTPTRRCVPGAHGTRGRGWWCPPPRCTHPHGWPVLAQSPLEAVFAPAKAVSPRASPDASVISDSTTAPVRRADRRPPPQPSPSPSPSPLTLQSRPPYVGCPRRVAGAGPRSAPTAAPDGGGARRRAAAARSRPAVTAARTASTAGSPPRPNTCTASR